MAPLSHFSLAGIPATCVYILVVYTASEVSFTESNLVNQAGFLIALGTAFYGNHQWFFERKIDTQSRPLRFLLLIMLVYLSSRLITFFVMHVMGLDHALALGAIVLIVPGINSLMSKFLAMPRSPLDGDDASSWTALGVVTSLLVAVFALTLLHGTSFNHDTSWYFIATRLWIAGAPLYSGVMELNPPLMFYLTRAILGVADLLVWSDEDAMRMALFLLIGASVFLGNRVLKPFPITAPKRAAMMVFCTMALLLIPLNSFGQREHLFVIFSLPYLMAQAMRFAGNDVPVLLRSLCVIFAIPGLLLKPYFLLLPALLSVYAAVRARCMERLLSLENGVIGITSLAYLGWVYAWHPDYFQTVIPLGNLTYFAFGKSIEQILFDPLLLILLSCCAPLAGKKLSTFDKQFAIALLLAGLASLAMYLIQLKGWNYHAVPYWSTTFLLASWLLVAGVKTKAWMWTVIPFALILKIVVAAQINQGPYLSGVAGQLHRAIGNENGKKIIIYSTNVSHAFPFVNEAKLQWTSRYPTQWIVPGAFVGLQRIPVGDIEARAPYEVALAFARRSAVEDFVLHKPNLVVVDTRHSKSYFNNYPFDWINFLSEDTDFSQEWSHYYLDKELTNFQIWRLRD